VTPAAEVPRGGEREHDYFGYRQQTVDHVVFREQDRDDPDVAEHRDRGEENDGDEVEEITLADSAQPGPAGFCLRGGHRRAHRPVPRLQPGGARRPRGGSGGACLHRVAVRVPSLAPLPLPLRRDRTVPDCFACATCVGVCPTGSVSLSAGRRALPPRGTSRSGGAREKPRPRKLLPPTRRSMWKIHPDSRQFRRMTRLNRPLPALITPILAVSALSVARCDPCFAYDVKIKDEGSANGSKESLR